MSEPKLIAVWVVAFCDYEHKSIRDIYDSLQSAIDGVKKIYGPPYIVKWDEFKEKTDGCYLVGHFEAVQGVFNRM
jgi:hypothetical protein